MAAVILDKAELEDIRDKPHQEVILGKPHQEVIPDKPHQEAIQDKLHQEAIQDKAATPAINHQAAVIQVTIHKERAMLHRVAHQPAPRPMFKECSVPLIRIDRVELVQRNYKLPYKMEKAKDSLINVVSLWFVSITSMTIKSVIVFNEAT